MGLLIRGKVGSSSAPVVKHLALKKRTWGVRTDAGPSRMFATKSWRSSGAGPKDRV